MKAKSNNRDIDAELAHMWRSANAEEPGPITDRVYRAMSDAEQRILKQIRPVVEKVTDHDNFISGFAKTFSHVAGFLRKSTATEENTENGGKIRAT